MQKEFQELAETHTQAFLRVWHEISQTEDHINQNTSLLESQCLIQQLYPLFDFKQSSTEHANNFYLLLRKMRQGNFLRKMHQITLIATIILPVIKEQQYMQTFCALPKQPYPILSFYMLSSKREFCPIMTARHGQRRLHN